MSSHRRVKKLGSVVSIAGALLVLAVACRAERTLGSLAPAATPGAPVASVPALPSSEPVSSAVPPPPPSLEPSCQPKDEQAWLLRLYPRQPTRKHRDALVSQRDALPGKLLCGEGGELFLELSTIQVRELLGDHASLRGLKGAGNSSDTCGWFASITPAHFVPRQFAQNVTSLDFDTDPKLALVNEVELCTSEAVRKPPRQASDGVGSVGR